MSASCPIADLFSDAAQPSTMHDPGGKGRLRLLPGVTGHAEFRGDRQEHRLTLERVWHGPHTDPAALPYALWCGMNPSTARHDEDDLTVRKEQHWTLRTLGLNRYVKVNFGSWRSTDPAGLAVPGLEISHPENLPTIIRLATAAHTVVLACGDPPDALLPHAVAAVKALRAAGVLPLCLGITKQGWPKHSSRLAYSTTFREFCP